MTASMHRHSLCFLTATIGGLGTATGRTLRAQGAKLALLYAPFEASRKDQTLQEVYGQSLQPSSKQADIKSYECDITSEASVSSAFQAIGEDLDPEAGFPSILVNAAGYVSIAPLEETTQEEALKNIHSNLLGPLLVSNAFARLYWSRDSLRLQKPPGRIVSISSQAAHVALDNHGAYCASKAGLMGLTRSMASEWGGRGITANTVSPTVALTVLGKKAWADEERRNAHLAQIPTGRFAQPDEIAQVSSLFELLGSL